MNDNDILNETIEDSVNDSLAGNSPDPVDTSDTDTSSTDVAVSASDAVPSPADNSNTPVKDDFAEKFGIKSESFTGRENRIPYSRVKKIVSRAEKEAKDALRQELEGQFNPKLTDFETKVKDYEDRIQKVSQFEQILANDPQTFLGMLSQLPAYKPFFDQLNANQQQAQPGQLTLQRDPATGRFTNQQQPAADPMPQPDQPLADGSMVYSMDGLQKLLDWNSRNVESRITKQVEQRYAPIEQSFQHQQQMAQIVPQIEKQIAEARTWDRFGELEPQIVQLLQSDPRMSLERAYMLAFQKNVVPKMVSDRNKLRTEILAELKKTPTSTSAPVRQLNQPFQNQPVNGKRDLTDVINESIQDLS